MGHGGGGGTYPTMLVKSGRLTNMCSVSSRNHVYIVEVRARSMAFFEPFDQDNRDHFFPENVQNYETNMCVKVILA